MTVGDINNIAILNIPTSYIQMLSTGVMNNSNRFNLNAINTSVLSILPGLNTS